MISLAKKDCCGCETCAQVCPRNCIEMVADKEGFKYPVIDKKKCIDCHLCEKSCPSLNKMNKADAEEDTSKTDCFVARNQSTERLNSSSGGIFVLLAKKILSEMMTDADRLIEYEKSGTNIAESASIFQTWINS